MNKVRQILFNWQCQQQPKRTVVIHPWEDVRTVAIIHDSVDVSHIAQAIEKGDRIVDVFQHPTQQEIQWLTGKPKNQLLDKLQRIHYDLLIDLTQQPSITMLYMAMLIKADFKTGRHTCEGIHDMTINTPPRDSADYLYQQILHYLQMLTNRQ